MTRDGLLDEAAPRSENEDPRHKFYRLTAAGRKVLRAEARRYEPIVDAARKCDVLAQSR